MVPLSHSIGLPLRAERLESKDGPLLAVSQGEEHPLRVRPRHGTLAEASLDRTARYLRQLHEEAVRSHLWNVEPALGENLSTKLLQACAVGVWGIGRASEDLHKQEPERPNVRSRSRLPRHLPALGRCVPGVLQPQASKEVVLLDDAHV